MGIGSIFFLTAEAQRAQRKNIFYLQLILPKNWRTGRTVNNKTQALWVKRKSELRNT
jgi:hypothetical protein